jgi:hypothetical protein
MAIGGGHRPRGGGGQEILQVWLADFFSRYKTAM